MARLHYPLSVQPSLGTPNQPLGLSNARRGYTWRGVRAATNYFLRHTILEAVCRQIRAVVPSLSTPVRDMGQRGSSMQIREAGRGTRNST